MGPFAAVVAALLASLQPAPPQTPPDADPNTVDEIVVQTDRRAAEAFVRRNAAPTKRGRLARFAGTVCPGVVGLPQKHGAYIADRIAEEALAVGLDVGEPGCTPDVVIFVTDRPDPLAERLATKYRATFAERPPRSSLLSGGGRQSLNSFVGRPRPVRWWHVAELVSADGRPLAMTELSGGNHPECGRAAHGGDQATAACPIGDPTNTAPALVNARATRVASNTTEHLRKVIIIVDSVRLRGVTYEALASYLAMASLAQLEVDAETGTAPTILSLFHDRDAGKPIPETLTHWDRAYLQGLYEAPADAPTLRSQRGAIRQRVEKAAKGG